MADQPTEKPDAPAPAAEGQDTAVVESQPEQTKSSAKEETKAEDTPKATDEAKKTAIEEKSEDKPEAEGDSEMPDAPDTSVVEGDQSVGAVGEKTPLTNNKNNRRKSAGGGGNRKSIGKKAAKPKKQYLDAQPGDHFTVKLKGFPEWPAIICDESMLPQALLNTRPVSAKRADGTWTEHYADGGRRMSDRGYAVMFLQTNEFAWIVNQSLTELDPDVAEKRANGPKLRKDLKLAFELAAQQHPIEYYKDLLQKFEEESIAEEERLAAELAMADATPKKSKKKAKGGDAEDVDMADADASVKSKSKKRKAEDGADTPQRPDSVKKPKIKLNTNSTPKDKGANGAGAKDSAKAKSKTKKAAKETAVQETPEEALKRKQKEVLYLRYKLQRGLLSKEGPPQDDEMVNMSKFITMLEAMSDLEASIIRETRINKVMKQIIKLDSIPKESEFNFKSRSQELLSKWNKVMSAEPAANGVNGTKSPTEEKKEETSDDKTDVKSGAKAGAEDKPAEKKDTEESKPEVKAADAAEPEKPSEPEEKAKEPAETPAVAA